MAQKELRLLRGGSWFNVPHGCRAALRYSNLPAYVNTDIGVRPCCLLPPGFLLGS
jgi:formylglycine-generating enzyme required for sulfatase activity